MKNTSFRKLTALWYLTSVVGTRKRAYIQLKIKNCKQFLQKAEADWNIRAFPVGSVLLLFKNSNKEVQA